MELMSNTMLVDVCVAYKGIYLSIEMKESSKLLFELST